MNEVGVGPNLMALVVHGVLIFLIVCFLDSGYFLRMRSVYSRVELITSEEVDSDVEAEARAAPQLFEAADLHQRNMVAYDLWKIFSGDPQATVKGISFAVSPCECFGILGSQGSGKTIVLKMLAALTAKSQGDAYTVKHVLSRQPRDVRETLFERLTFSSELNCIILLREDLFRE